MRTKAENILFNVTSTENGDIAARLYNFANLLKQEKGSLSASSVGDALEKLVRWSTPFEYQKAVNCIKNEYREKMREFERTRDEIAEELREDIEGDLRKEYAADIDELADLREWKDENEYKIDAYDSLNGDIIDAMDRADSEKWNYTQISNVCEAIEAAGRGEW